MGELLGLIFWGFVAYRAYLYFQTRSKQRAAGTGHDSEDGSSTESPEEARKKRWLMSPKGVRSTLEEMRRLRSDGQALEAIGLGHDIIDQEEFRASDAGVKLLKKARRRVDATASSHNAGAAKTDPALGDVGLLLAEMLIEQALRSTKDRGKDGRGDALARVACLKFHKALDLIEFHDDKDHAEELKTKQASRVCLERMVVLSLLGQTEVCNECHLSLPRPSAT